MRERLETELAVVEKMGFPPYFLIVWDFVSLRQEQRASRWARAAARRPARWCRYLLGITDLDPIAYDLLFERFLNPDRISMPDIDIDFSVEGREKVIEYVADKYGRDRVAQIATFGTIKARQAIRDAARVMDVPYSQADRIAKLVPEVLNITLDDCLADAKGELRSAYDTDDAGARGRRHGPAARGAHPPGLHPRRRRGHLRRAAHRLPAPACRRATPRWSPRSP